MIDYESLKAHVDVYSLDRDADVSRDEFRGFVWRSRLLAAAILVSAGLLAFRGSKLDNVTTTVGGEWWVFVRTAPSGLARWAREESSLHVGVLVAVLAIGIGLRIAFLDAPMRYDEAATYNAFVSEPLYVSLANYSVPNNHLFHTFLAKLSVVTFGNDPWWLRLPALLAGIAIIPAAFAFALRVYGRTAAVITAALVATSSTLVEYSTNARGYTLVTLFTLASLLAAIRVLENGSTGAWAAIGLFGALGFYTVPVMMYAFGGVLVWIAMSHVMQGNSLGTLVRPLLACVSFTIALTGLLYVPVFAATGIGSVTSNEFVTPKAFDDFLAGLPSHAWATLETWGRDLPVAGSLILAVGLVFSLVLSRRLSRYPFPPLAAFLVWALPVIAVQRVIPFSRVWLFLVPVALAASAGFFGWVIDQKRSATLVGGAAASLIASISVALVVSADSVRTSRETGALPDAPEIARYLEATLRPGDGVLAIGSDAILAYYLERDGYDATSIWHRTGQRIVVVVNRTGGDQTLRGALGELSTEVEFSPPRPLRRWPSADLFLVEVV